MPPDAVTVARIIGDGYDRHVANLSPDDFWGQVKRHVAGRPVGADQIQLIVGAIRDGLGFAPTDVLLDLACGNGALTHELFGECAGCLGVDVSSALIAIAQRQFAKPGFAFTAGDVARYVDEEQHPERFTKALCYGAFPYLHPESAHHLLAGLRERFVGLERIFIGNLPDLNQVQAFYPRCPINHPALFEPLTDIGIWRAPDEFVALAAAAGWEAKLRAMPPAFYAAHYRYDALLTRRR